MGEETEGAVESTSKLQAQLKALTGVDILTNSGAYKDTFTILKEIGAVWQDMDSMDQAAALELMAGKNRANTLAAILNNTEDLEGAYESAMNAEGSALAENEAYLDSIQGRIDQFNNAVQTMWMNLINSDVIKFIVNLGTGLVGIIDKVGTLGVALGGVLAYFSLSKKTDFDLVSALGIHDIEKGFSVFGKEGLTGWFSKDQRDARKKKRAEKKKERADVPSLQTKKDEAKAAEEAKRQQKQQEEALRRQRQQEEAQRIQAQKEEAEMLKRQQVEAKKEQSKQAKKTKQSSDSKGGIFKNLFKKDKTSAKKVEEKRNPYDNIFFDRSAHIDGSYIWEVEQKKEEIEAEIKDLLMDDHPKYNGKDLVPLREEAFAKKAEYEKQLKYLHAKREEYLKDGTQLDPTSNVVDSLNAGVKDVQASAQQMGEAIGSGITNFDTSELDNKIVDIEDRLASVRETYAHNRDMARNTDLSDSEREWHEKNRKKGLAEITELSHEESRLKTQRMQIAQAGRQQGVEVPNLKDATEKIRQLREIDKQLPDATKQYEMALDNYKFIEELASREDASSVSAKAELPKVKKRFEDAKARLDELKKQREILEPSTTKTTDVPQVQGAVEAVKEAVEDVKAPAQAFGQAIQDGITSIDTSEIDAKISDVKFKLDVEEVKAKKNPGAKHDSKETDRLKEELASLEKKKQEMLSASTSTSSNVSQINAETNAYEQLGQVIDDVSQKKQDMQTPAAQPTTTAQQPQPKPQQNMSDFLKEIQGVELEFGDANYVATQLDAIKAASEGGQESLMGFLSAMDSTDAVTGKTNAALKAYAATVKDGQYSVAGFEQFVQQNNAALKATATSTKLAALGHQALNAAMSMGIGLLVNVAIQGAIKLWDEFANAAENAAERAKEALNAYRDSQKALRDQKSNIEVLSDKYEKLSIGVDVNTNDNINLSTSAYQEYLDVCNDIADIYPELVTGFDAQGNAILSLTGQANELTQIYEDMARASRDALKNSSDDIFGTFKNKFSNDRRRDFGYIQQIDILENVVEQLNNGTFDPQNYSPSERKDLRAVFNDANINYDELIDMVSVFDPTGLESTIEVLNVDEVREATQKAQTYLRTLNALVLEEERNMHGLLNAYLLDDGLYDMMSNRSKTVVQSLISSLSAEFMNDEQFDDFDSLWEWVQDKILIPFTDPSFGEALSTNVSDALQLNIKFKRDSMSLDNYSDEMMRYISSIMNNPNLDSEVQDALLEMFGFDPDTVRSAIRGGEETYGRVVDEMLAYAETLFSEDANFLANNLLSLNYSDLEIINSEEFGIEAGTLRTWDELKKRIWEIKQMTGQGVASVQTFSATNADIQSYNDLLNQTSEIIVDNTEVTQEYKDALMGLGISAEDLNECFYSNNKLVVKDANALNNLVKSAKSNTVQNIRLAKSQASLQYYELYKEMRELTNGTQTYDAAVLSNINSLNEEMNAIEKTIAKYNMLEQSLLGAANAYSEVEAAQQTDEATDYRSQAENLVNILASAFSSGELGTESAQVAIEGLVPESVIEDATTLDEKMQKIYEYFTNGTVSQLFKIEFDDNGGVSSVEMTKDNVLGFIDNLLEQGIFHGTTEDFTLDPQITSLEQFAEQANVTKEVAFAFLSGLERYDISWLNGDYSTLMDQLMGDDLEYQIYNTTKQMADLEHQFATGKIGIEEYTKQMNGMQGAFRAGHIDADTYNTFLEDLNRQWAEGTITAEEYKRQLYGLNDVNAANSQAARQNVQDWNDKTSALEEQKNKIQEYQELLNSAEERNGVWYSADGEVINVDEVRENIDTAAAEVIRLNEELVEIGQPTELVFQIALDSVQSQLDAIESRIGEVVEGRHYELNVETGKYEVKAEFTNNQDVVNFVNLLNEKHTIEMSMGESATSAVDTLKTIATTLENIANLLSQKFELNVETSDSWSNVNSFLGLWDQIKSKTVTLTQRIRAFTEGGGISGVLSNWFGGGSVNGTAHAQGTTGSWGAEKTETSLVGELGPELRVRGNQWSLIGQNGAEFTDVKKGDIIK